MIVEGEKVLLLRWLRVFKLGAVVVMVAIVGSIINNVFSKSIYTSISV